MNGAKRLKIAFWNVMNLFEPKTHPPGKGGKPAARGPQGNQELNDKLNRLAECIDAFFLGAGPDLLGLAEVHNLRILLELEKRLKDRYQYVWEPAGNNRETGLAVLARSSLVSGLAKLDAYRPANMSGARPRVMISRCEFQGVSEPFLFVVNHWKSNMYHSGAAFTPAEDREQTADWLGTRLSNSYRDTCVILVGDFNAEPHEQPFSEFRLRSSRHFHAALGNQGTPAYLYNTSWKFLCEPLPWEDSVRAGGGLKDPRPKRSHDGAYVVWDQLMVSGRAMKNGPLRLIEKTVDYYRDGHNSVYNKCGSVCPIRWTYQAPGKYSGASDHYPVTAEFAVE